MRMNAYYYSFTPTGVEAIDRILSAVACAGKAYHHTEGWSESANPPEYLRGEDPIEWIQNAANDAAAALKTPESAPAMKRQQRTICSGAMDCPDTGGPCENCLCWHCGGQGYTPGDPKAAPIEGCLSCNGTGRHVPTLKSPERAP